MPNNNRQTVDLPFFELCNQSPSTTSSLGGMTTVEDGTGRYLYVIQSIAFYRYDKVADTWQTLSNHPTTPSSAMSLKYVSNRGFHGRVISSTSTSVTIPALRSGVFDGEKIRILSGTGAGQERTLTYVSDTIHDAGVITTGAQTTYITDNLKKWKQNQWAGYGLLISFGTGITQFRKILYNNAQTLFVSDTQLAKIDPWNNDAFRSSIPYSTPATGAHYKIISSTYNVSSWDIAPDYTSFFTTLTGGIYSMTNVTSAPFMVMHYYDIANDMWFRKTTNQGLFSLSNTTDTTIERIGRVGAALTTSVGTISAPSNRTLRDLDQNFSSNDRYANHRIEITGGTGRGQNRRIVGHTTNTYTIERNWSVSPDGTSTYGIWADYDKIYFARGNSEAAIVAYSQEGDHWMQGQSFDYGMSNNIGVGFTNGAFTQFGVTSGAIIANGIRTINPVPTAAGTGYEIGDVAVCNTGGTGAQVRVTNITTSGAVTGIELIHSGTATGFTVGTGRATTQTGGLGSGSGLTIEITSVGETVLVTTATAHFFEAGDVVTFAGNTTAGWNTSYTILGVPFSTSATTPTTFCMVSNVGANMAATSSQSTTLVVDASKNWVVNEHVGRLVQINASGVSAPTAQIRWITANTATTLTVATITAAITGQSDYVIYDSKIFGVDKQKKEDGKEPYGYATSGSTTTLVDSTKSWIPNQWVNYFFKVESGTGYGSGRILITASTSNTLTFATQTFTPDTTTKYEIADSWGLMSSATTSNITEATNKNWATNQWQNKIVKVTGGTGSGQENTVSSNTATALTLSASFTTGPDTTSTYAILANNPRGSGINLMHIFGGTDSNKKGRYLIIPRGGGNYSWEIYDIPTGRWITPDFTLPQSEGWTSGSSYCYDGIDTIYASRSSSSNIIRIFKYNINTAKFDGLMTTTFVQGTAHIGNFMEIMSDSTGEFKYLYVLQNSGQLLARALIF